MSEETKSISVADTLISLSHTKPATDGSRPGDSIDFASALHAEVQVSPLSEAALRDRLNDLFAVQVSTVKLAAWLLQGGVDRGYGRDHVGVYEQDVHRHVSIAKALVQIGIPQPMPEVPAEVQQRMKERWQRLVSSVDDEMVTVKRKDLETVVLACANSDAGLDERSGAVTPFVEMFGLDEDVEGEDGEA